MEAVWIMDYDYQTDETYDRPGCPNCEAPIIRHADGQCRCLDCGGIVTVADDEMRKWLEDREGEKVEMHDCKKYELGDGKTFGCGGKACVETHYMRNNVTKEWLVSWGECTKCGMRFMV